MPKVDDHSDETIIFNDEFQEELQTELRNNEDFHIGTIKDKPTEVIEEVPEEPSKPEVQFHLDDFKDDKIFKTQEVANICGLDPQIVRNRANTWNPVLKLEKSSNGVTMWTKENIILFQEMNIKYDIGRQESGMTVNDVLKYYNTAPEEENKELPTINVDMMKDMFAEMTERIANTVSENVEKAVDARMEQYNVKMLEAKNENDSNKEAMEEILSIVKALKKRDEEREKELKALREENERLKEQPQEPPKKKFLGIF